MLMSVIVWRVGAPDPSTATHMLVDSIGLMRKGDDGVWRSGDGREWSVAFDGECVVVEPTYCLARSVSRLLLQAC